MSAPRVVCLVGPTASGKTTLALELGETLGAEVVSVDSRQIYRRMDIGTAKPTPDERRQVRAPLPGHSRPEETFDAARFRAAARRPLDDVRARGRHALVVGTGLWVRVLRRPRPAPPRRRRCAGYLRSPHSVVPTGYAISPCSTARGGACTRATRCVERAPRWYLFSSGKRLSDWQAAHRFAGVASTPCSSGSRSPCRT
jgi:hypothetical protein